MDGAGQVAAMMRDDATERRQKQEQARLLEAEKRKRREEEALRQEEMRQHREEVEARQREDDEAKLQQLAEKSREEARIMNELKEECNRLVECLQLPGKPLPHARPRNRVLPTGHETSSLATRIFGPGASAKELDAVQWVRGESRTKKKLAPVCIYADMEDPVDEKLQPDAPCTVCGR